MPVPEQGLDSPLPSLLQFRFPAFVVFDTIQGVEEFLLSLHQLIEPGLTSLRALAFKEAPAQRPRGIRGLDQLSSNGAFSLGFHKLPPLQTLLTLPQNGADINKKL